MNNCFCYKTFLGKFSEQHIFVLDHYSTSILCTEIPYEVTLVFDVPEIWLDMKKSDNKRVMKEKGKNYFDLTPMIKEIKTNREKNKISINFESIDE